MIEDFTRTGCPSTANNEDIMKKVKKIVLQNRHTRLKELVILFNVAFRTAQSIAVDILDMRCVTARLVKKDLTFVDKHHQTPFA